MRRRAVITLIGGGLVSALWPLRARSADKVYRIAFVVPIGQFVDAKEGDAWKGLVTAFLQGLREQEHEIRVLLSRGEVRANR
jgi:putative tryptophan/tyrosine transport system substrate-binding protein